MHKINFDLSLEEITKVEGHASLVLKVRDNKVKDLKFEIAEYKRFYTQAIRNKDIFSIPQIVSRICGTCSNAHLLCSIEALEKALKIKVSHQVLLLRRLLINGLMIRDHALHLYVFVLPDLYNKDSILDFDEKNPEEHKLLHDAFAIKRAGNKLSTWVGGRSVHAPYPIVGGFSRLPENEGKEDIIAALEDARHRVLSLIEIFKNCTFSIQEKLDFVALKSNEYDFLEGYIASLSSPNFQEFDYGKHLEKKVIPYSQAVGYKFDKDIYMLGALARINLSKDRLNKRTKKDLKDTLSLFPSNNIYHNNLAQAIEILHCIDTSIDTLSNLDIRKEKPINFKDYLKDSVGVGVIEAPRGTLYYKLEVGKDGRIKRGDIVVPTGQNQIAIERTLLHFVQNNLTLPKEKLAFELEKIIRAFDPCLSCASHFLKLKFI